MDRKRQIQMLEASAEIRTLELVQEQQEHCYKAVHRNSRWISRLMKVALEQEVMPEEHLLCRMVTRRGDCRMTASPKSRGNPLPTTAMALECWIKTIWWNPTSSWVNQALPTPIFTPTWETNLRNMLRIKNRLQQTKHSKSSSQNHRTLRTRWWPIRTMANSKPYPKTLPEWTVSTNEAPPDKVSTSQNSVLEPLLPNLNFKCNLNIINQVKKCSNNIWCRVQIRRSGHMEVRRRLKDSNLNWQVILNLNKISNLLHQELGRCRIMVRAHRLWTSVKTSICLSNRSKTKLKAVKLQQVPQRFRSQIRYMEVLQCRAQYTAITTWPTWKNEQKFNSKLSKSWVQQITTSRNILFYFIL